MMVRSVALFVVSVLVLVSCRSDKPEVKPDAPVTAQPGSGVFIGNEGNFQWGNASVSFYKFSDGAVSEDVFKSANNRPLGDVLQSMSLYNGKFYLVLNNSNKIEIVNPGDFKSVGVIQGLTSPRYFLGISSSKAYVTDLYSNAISVVDLNSNAKIKDIPCKGWTEELVLSNGKAFVTNKKQEYVYIINTISDTKKDSILVGYGSNSICEDKNGKLWVLCEGDNSTVVGGLHRIDPVTEQIEQTFNFNTVGESPWRLRINGTKDTLYFLNHGLYQFPIVNSSLPTSPLVAQNSLVFYSLGIDPVSNIIYVSDAIDYVQKGKIYRYKADGTLINTFNVGITPNDFYFY